MCEPPGVELLAGNGIDELFFGEAKVLWGVSEENHTGCWSIQRTGKAVTVGPIKLNPDNSTTTKIIDTQEGYGYRLRIAAGDHGITSSYDNTIITND